MIVRAAGEDDFGGAVALYREFAQQIPVADGPDGFAQWRALLEYPGTTVFVAELEHRLVATTTLHILPNITYGGMPYAFIENVITARDHRGLGAGRQVVEAAIEAAWSENVYKIMLLTGKRREDNGARGFYEKIGFSADEEFGMTLRQVPPRS